MIYCRGNGLDIILAAVGAVLAFFTFVGGQFILKLIIEPTQAMKKTIGEVSHALIAYSKIISTPNAFDNDKKHSVYEHLNVLSAQLQASYYLIPKYIRHNNKWLLRLFDLPSQDAVSKSSHQLQTLANCLYSSGNERMRRSDQIISLKKNICSNLDIFRLEEQEY